MRILGIETSCDETGIAIYDQYQGLLINQVYSQSMIHAEYGGVVPELAARNHVQKIVPLIISVLQQTNLNSKDIHGIAYTAGPGLIGSLLVGATVAKTLAYAWKVPIVDIHHMEAHLLTPMMEKNVSFEVPCLALLVSGGHTQLVLVHNIGEYQILGESVDDAIGEVFDKIAILLGLKYPGGALLSQIARHGVLGRYVFPRPMIKKPGLNFSFSGLKTFVAQTIIMLKLNDMQTRADIACAFEDAIFDTLVIKCRRALHQTGLKCLIVSGGVSANCVLRARLAKMMYILKGNVFYPRLELCTDNGAMIAYTGLIRLRAGLSVNDLSVVVRPRWSLESVPKIKCII